jgi:hypothetical protein
MTKFCKTNTNSFIKVKLKPAGVEILRKQHESIFYKDLERFPFKTPQVDNDGYTKFQMWVFMRTFGNFLVWGGEAPFETDVLVELN